MKLGIQSKIRVKFKDFFFGEEEGGVKESQLCSKIVNEAVEVNSK